MSTGVDAQTCRVIVLDQTIQSMTEFKQIIGRGTRIREDYGKLYFTILDFKKATELFADPAFDGDRVRVYVPQDDQTVVPPDDDDGSPLPPDETPISTVDPLAPIDTDTPAEVTSSATGSWTGNGDNRTDEGKRLKYVVGDVPVYVVAERVQHYGSDGKLVTESLRDYTRKAIRKQYRTLDAFLRTWTQAERKQAIIDELEEQGVFLEPLAAEVGQELSEFDLVCHVAFDQPPLTRKERANNVRKRNYFSKYSEQARKVLDALLDKFADEGVDDIEDMGILKVRPLNQHGSPVEIVRTFGGREPYLRAVQELEDELYRAS